MSKTVDERVVSLQLDNKNLESNAKTSMSTLDKLKDKLNFKGAAKGADTLGAAVKKVDMSGLGKGVTDVHAKFSALEVIGVTALANITNSAVNCGKRMLSALTIQPITTGFQEYETQMNAVQTILANTQSKGSTLDDVNNALAKLNEYADQTIYNFTEMTRNIGTFTAAGVDLNTSVNAIQGIANLAAVSGSTSQQASTAMYQLSQALAAGTVKLMDWNSVVNAGMGGEIFQNALKETSKLLGTGAEAAIEAQGSFRESLKTGWLTSEVLTETLKKFTTSGANEYVAEYTGLTVDAVEAALESAKAQYGEAEAVDKAAEALANKSGKSKDEIKKTLEMAQTAQDAATKVKTFSQLWDVMKEAAQSGWSQTWQIIVGDFEEAKNLLSPLADFFTKIIGKISKARNDLLKSALGRGFTKTIENVNNAFSKTKKSIDAVLDPVKKVSGALGTLGEVADKVILGKFGNGIDRYKALTEAGENYYKIQNKVNETLGNTFRYSDKQIEAQDKLLGSTAKTMAKTEDQAKATGKLTAEKKELLKKLAAMSEEQFKAAGYGEEQAEALKELREQADKLGLPLDKFIDNLDQINGRWLLINSFKNIGSSIVAIFKAIGEAWSETFGKVVTGEGIFNIIAGFHKLTAKLKELVGEGDLVKRVFKGVFTVLKLVVKVITTPFKIAFKALSAIFKAFDTNILEVAAHIGDLLVKFGNWCKETFDLSGAFKKLSPYLKSMWESLKSIFKSIKESEAFKTFTKYVKDAATGLKDWFKNLNLGDRAIDFFKKIADAMSKWAEALKSGKGIPKDFVEGLANGFSKGAGKLWETLKNFATKILTVVKDVLGIHSPSTEGKEIGNNFILGIFNGIKDFATMLFDLVMSVGKKLIELVKGLDMGTVITGLFAAGSVIGFIKIANAIGKIAAPFEAFGDVMAAAEKAVEGFTLRMKAEAIKSIAIAIALLAGSVAVLAMLPAGKVWSSVGAIAALAAILLIFTAVMNKFGGTTKAANPKKAFEFGKLALAIVGIAAAILLIATALKKMGSMTTDQMKQALEGLLGITLSMVAILLAFKRFGKFDASTGKAIASIYKVGAAMLLMVMVAKIAGGMDREELIQGGLAVIAFGGIIVGLMAATKLLTGSTNVGKIGSAILGVAAAILLIAMIAKFVGGMNPNELQQGVMAVGVFAGIIIGLMAATKLIGSSKNVGKIGSAILGVAAAMLLMALTARITASMSTEEFIKGTSIIGLFGGMIVALIACTKLVGGSKNVGEIGKTILMISLAIGILAAVAVLMGLVSIENLVKGTLAVSYLAALIAGLMYISKFTDKSSMGSIIAITVAIAVLVTALIALTFVDPAKLFKVSAVLGGIMLLFGVVTKMAGSVKGATGAIVAMSAAILALGGVLYLLAKIPFEQTIGAAASLSALMTVMIGVLWLLGNQSSTINKALGGVVMLLALAIPMLAFAGILMLMQNAQNAIPSVIAISLLMTAMIGVIALLGIISSLATTALPGLLVLTLMAVPMIAFALVLSLMPNADAAQKNALTLVMLMTVCAILLPLLALIGVMWIPAAIGILALTAMAVPMLAFVGVLAVMQNIQNAAANVELLIGLMKSLASILLILAPIAPLVVLGVTALSMLTLLMVQVGLMAVAIGALMTKFPALQEFLNTGIPVMVQLAGGIGQMIGAFVAGVATQIANALPNIAMQMSLFMTNIQPFIEGAKMIDASVLIGIAILSASIIALCAADLIAGITSFLTGGTSFAELGTQLSLFMTNAMPFIIGSKMIDPSIMEGVKTLAEAILILTGANLMEQITSWFGGEASLATFGSQLGDLGTNLSTFVTNLGTFSTEQVATVQCACDAIKAIADAAGELPNDGGVAGFFAGENSIDVFADRLPDLGTHMQEFVTNLGTFNDRQVTTIGSACDAIKLIAEAAGELPNDGGVAGFFAGENSIDKFGDRLPGLGTHLAAFVINLGTFSDAQVVTVQCACDAIKAIAEAAAELPNDGGVAGFFAGENDMEKFGNKLPGLGTNLKNFVKSLGTFSDTQVATVDSVVKALNSFAKIGGKKINPDNVSEMGSAMKSLGSKLKSFCKSVNGIGSDSIESAVSGLKKMIDAVKKLGGKDSETVKSLSKSLKSLGESGLKKFTEAFSGDDASAKVKKAATTMITTLTTGMNDNIESVKTKAGEVASAVTGKLTAKKFKTSITDAGKNVATGFANGIKNNKYLASDAGSALGKAALKAAKEALDENSPSKEMYKIGEFAGVGYVNALYDYVAIADRAGSDIAKSSLDGLKGSLSRISDLVMNDIDSEPTIRPVLDLSAVESGARSIGGMFSGSTLAVNAKAGTVSAMMRGYQNGRNSDELASQIKGLRKDLNNTPRNSYNINGVSVEEGSSAADAIRELVRYARVEGRA